MHPPILPFCPSSGPPPCKNRTPKQNIGAEPPHLHRGHRKVPPPPPLPLCPSFSPTHVSTGCLKQMHSLHLSPASLFCVPLHAQQLPLSPPAPTRTRTQHTNKHAGTLRPVCIGGAEGTYPLLSPSSPQHSPLPLFLRLLCFVHAPSRFHPLFATCTGGYFPLPACLKRGCAAKWCLHAHPPSSCATPP